MTFTLIRRLAAGLLTAAVGLGGMTVAGDAAARIMGQSCTTASCAFNLVAADGYVSAADGASIYTWGYGVDGGAAATLQFPGPTLIVNQGAMVTINLRNTLPMATSIVFPGNRLTGSTGATGVVTTEAAANNGTATYTFVATQPGTYYYHSGTQIDLQTEMGLGGTLIVRPTGFDAGTPAGRRAYHHPDTRFDREVLAVLSEVDPVIHDKVREQVEAIRAGTQITPIVADFSQWKPVYWFMSGRTGPDTMVEANSRQLPNQPYNVAPRMLPGERLLLRIVNAGRDLHPMHHHGNNSWTIARDGRVLSSAGVGNATTPSAPNLAQSDYTIRAVPGQTVDAVYSWTGAGLGWDISGGRDGACTPNATLANGGCAVRPAGIADTAFGQLPSTQLATDRNSLYALITVPPTQALNFGEYFSGSPFLGQTTSRPVGAGLGNGSGFYTHLFHSHNEREIVNNDIFPGGLLTFIVIESAPFTE